MSERTIFIKSFLKTIFGVSFICLLLLMSISIGIDYASPYIIAAGRTILCLFDFCTYIYFLCFIPSVIAVTNIFTTRKPYVKIKLTAFIITCVILFIDLTRYALFLTKENKGISSFIYSFILLFLINIIELVNNKPNEIDKNKRVSERTSVILTYTAYTATVLVSLRLFYNVFLWFF